MILAQSLLQFGLQRVVWWIDWEVEQCMSISVLVGLMLASAPIADDAIIVSPAAIVEHV